MTSTDRRADAETFRAAASLIERDIAHCGCCFAIEQAGGKGYLPEGRHAQMMLKTFPEGMQGGWGGYRANGGDPDQSPRILALCFMAAMVEAGDA